jgi:hypothetical protein
MKGTFLWVGALAGAIAGYFAASFVGNLGLALGGGAIAGMVVSQAFYFRR